MLTYRRTGSRLVDCLMLGEGADYARSTTLSSMCVCALVPRCMQHNIGRGDMPDDAGGRIIPLPAIFCKGKVHSICACLAINHMESQVIAAVVDYCSICPSWQHAHAGLLPAKVFVARLLVTLAF